jgi:hypothetical protein
VEVRILLPEWMDDVTPGQLLLVVTPRSERGGRWFDSSPRIWKWSRCRRTIDGSQPAGSGACLENRWRCRPLVGSSPTASASAIRRASPFTRGERPGTPTGRPARLKPGRLWVRIPPWAIRSASIQMGDDATGTNFGSVGNWQTTLVQTERC